MNVLKGLMTAILRQLVTTLKEVLPALVTLDTLGMGLLAQVNASTNTVQGDCYVSRTQ